MADGDPVDQSNDPDGEHNPSSGAPAGGLTTAEVARSVAAAAIGVQSRANRERDFSSGRALPFIIGGVVFTALFVLAIVGVVNLVLP